MAAVKTSQAHSYWNMASNFASAKWQQLAQTDLGKRVSTFIDENPQAKKVATALQSRGGKDATAGATIAAFLLASPGEGFGWGVVKTAIGASAIWCYKRYYNPAPTAQKASVASSVSSAVCATGSSSASAPRRASIPSPVAGATSSSPTSATQRAASADSFANASDGSVRSANSESKQTNSSAKSN